MHWVLAEAPEQQPQSSVCQRRQRQWMEWCAFLSILLQAALWPHAKAQSLCSAQQQAKCLLVLTCRPDQSARVLACARMKR